ncbi:MAG: carbon-nitrogen hydrolase family protein [Clostridia bacterium]|nr:carbon-nitrogen hydrolase family protein [Clostridia bacterium]
MSIHVASVQMKSGLGDIRGNLETMERFVRRIRKEEPETDLILFPECVLSGYECPDLIPSLAETWPDGSGIRSVRKMAEASSVFIAFGFPELGEDGFVYNCAGLIDRHGNPVGKYRKTHLLNGMESSIYKAGDQFPVFETEIGKIGIMICWDSVFPEAARMLSLHGAELILIPEAVEKGIEREWDLALCARAFDNGTFILSSNNTGMDRNLDYFGRSALISPSGQIIKQLGDSADYLSGEVDFKCVQEQREYFYMLKNIRPDIYR